MEGRRTEGDFGVEKTAQHLELPRPVLLGGLGKGAPPLWASERSVKARIASENQRSHPVKPISGLHNGVVVIKIYNEGSTSSFTVGLSRMILWPKTYRWTETCQNYDFFPGHSVVPLSPVFLQLMPETLSIEKKKNKFNPSVLRNLRVNRLPCLCASQNPQLCRCAAWLWLRLYRSPKSWWMGSRFGGAHPRPSLSPLLCE